MTKFNFLTRQLHGFFSHLNVVVKIFSEDITFNFVEKKLYNFCSQLHVRPTSPTMKLFG